MIRIKSDFGALCIRLVINYRKKGKNRDFFEKTAHCSRMKSTEKESEKLKGNRAGSKSFIIIFLFVIINLCLFYHTESALPKLGLVFCICDVLSVLAAIKQNSGNRKQLLRILLKNNERKRIYGAQLNKEQTSRI